MEETPLCIYTMWHAKTLPPNMEENLELLKKVNPEFQVKLFDDEECFQFINENFETDVAHAYKKLLPHAYKSDLWRYCVLYICGGVYIDIKFKCINNFKLISLIKEENFVVDKENIMTGLLVCKKGNEILRKCIHSVVENCKNNFYGLDCLHPTGPRLLGSFFTEEEKSKIPIRFHKTTKNTGIILRNTFILVYYEQYREEQKIYQSTKYYADLWKEKNIYNIQDVKV